jgi:hypothetical protein
VVELVLELDHHHIQGIGSNSRICTLLTKASCKGNHCLCKTSRILDSTAMSWH